MLIPREIVSTFINTSNRSSFYLISLTLALTLMVKVHVNDAIEINVFLPNINLGWMTFKEITVHRL